MASLFKAIFSPRASPVANKQARGVENNAAYILISLILCHPLFFLQGKDDSYQTIDNSQPLNVYQEVLLLKGHQAPINHLRRLNTTQ